MSSKAERERAGRKLVDAAADFLTTCTGSVGIVQIDGINVTVHDMGKRAERIERTMLQRCLDVFDPRAPSIEPQKGRYPPTPDPGKVGAWTPNTAYERRPICYGDPPVYDHACRPFASGSERMPPVPDDQRASAVTVEADGTTSEAEARRLAGMQAIADRIAAQGGPRIPVDAVPNPSMQAAGLSYVDALRTVPAGTPLDAREVGLQLASLAAGLGSLADELGRPANSRMLSAMLAAEEEYWSKTGA